MDRSRELTAYSALTTAAIVWGGSVVAQKISLGSFSPVEVSVFRGFGALMILVPLWWWTERRVSISLRDWGFLGILGVGVLGNHLLVLFGLQFIGAGGAGIIIGASPVITAFLSYLILRDVPFSKVWFGCVMSFAGVAFVSWGGAKEGAGENPLIGGVLIVLALTSWALYTIGSRRVMERFSPLTVNWTTLLISIVLQIPLLWTNNKMLVHGIETVPLSGWIALVYVVVFATALGQQAWLFWSRRSWAFSSRYFCESYSRFGDGALLSLVRGGYWGEGNVRHCSHPQWGLVCQPVKFEFFAKG